MRHSALFTVATLVGLFGASVAAHPVHVSSAQVELSKDEKSLAITIRFFTDDLEEALKSAGQGVAITRAPAAAVDSALSMFLAERLQVGCDGQLPARGRLAGHDREGDATIVFIVIPVRAVPGRVVVVHRAMLDVFADQSNLVHLRIGTKKRSALLRRGNERAEFVM